MNEILQDYITEGKKRFGKSEWSLVWIVNKQAHFNSVFNF